jgi:hypothetical protein
VNEQPVARRSVASVLVVAADPNIASLCGELVAFAGHRPKHDFTNGAAGESVRRERPDIAMIDAALECHIVDACVDACDEVLARPVLTSSTASEVELLEQAQTRGCIPFPLPGRPQTLGFILDRVLRTSRRPSVQPPALPVRTAMQPAFCAAIAHMSRARTLQSRARQVVTMNRFAHIELHEALESLRRSRDALRAAVRDFAASLRRDDVPELRMLDVVEKTMSDCAAIVGGESALEPIQGEWREWALEAYRAA